MKLDCILMDLDGSTLNPDGSIPEGLRASIAMNSSIRWIIVTGRGHASASQLPHAKIVQPTVPHVFDGGSTVMTITKGNVLHAKTLGTQVADKLVASLDYSVTQYVYASGGSSGTGLCWFSKGMQLAKPIADQATQNVETFRYWLKSMSVAKLTICADSFAQRDEGLTYKRNGKVIDVTPGGIDKGWGACIIFEHLKIAPEKSLFIFNDSNDLPVLENHFFSKIGRLKVGSSLPQVRADYVAPNPCDVPRVLRALGLAT